MVLQVTLSVHLQQSKVTDSGIHIDHEQPHPRILESLRILDRLGRFCSFEMSGEMVRDWCPTTDLGEARLWQQETEEARKSVNDIM